MVRVGIGFDAHRFARGRRLVLGGVAIPFKLGLLGHSDADVLCHAMADALLGSVALGDIGMHFPDSDPRYKGMRSVEIVRAAAAKLAAKGFSVVNVDATILAEQPRLAPHVPEMRRILSKALGVGVSCVSIKATTVEGMGALGRGEGMAAMAVASVETHRPRRSVARGRGK